MCCPIKGLGRSRFKKLKDGIQARFRSFRSYFNRNKFDSKVVNNAFGAAEGVVEDKITVAGAGVGIASYETVSSFKLVIIYVCFIQIKIIFFALSFNINLYL